MLKSKLFFVLFLVCGLWSWVSGLASADTIYLNDGQEVKGIVVEEYNDRITFSTADGEISIMKTNIKELQFDTEEDNLIKLAELAQGQKDYTKAYTYYDLAIKLNPDSKRAKDGIIFLQGYMFRKKEIDKEELIKRRDEIEKYGAFIDTQKKGEDEFKEAAEKLRKTIGITLKSKGNLPDIATIAVKSAAYEAGVRQGDLLVAVWGKLTGYMSLKEVMGLLLEKPAREIKATIERTINVGSNEAAFTMEFDGLTVSKVNEDGSGLKKGDLVVAIDGKSTRYMPLKKALEMIRDSKERSVKLTIRRELVLWRGEMT